MSNGSSSHFISLEKAVEMTKRYRQNREAVTNPTYAGKDILALSGKFDRSVFDILLAKPDCTAIRVYYGMDIDLKINPIVVAVNTNNEDILPTVSILEGEDIGDDIIRCPPICPPASPLNQ